jgi:hypothetical protein
VFGPVQRRISAANDFVRALGLRVSLGHADADRHARLAGGGDLHRHPFRQCMCLGQMNARQQHAELLAAPARDEVTDP